MTSLLECNARAAMCRHFARLEPDSRYIWLAEAERWSRLTKENSDQVEAQREGIRLGVGYRMGCEQSGTRAS